MNGDTLLQRKLTSKKTANYRISRGRRMVEKTFGILVSSFRVVLGTMEQSSKVARQIVLISVAPWSKVQRLPDRLF